MAFSVPNFNLTCNIFRGPYLTRFLALPGWPCNLAYSRRVQTMSAATATTDSGTIVMSLLLPAGTDVRDLSCSFDEDVIECPAGSGRWYQVSSVDDVGKGFPNEYRMANIFAISESRYGGGYLGLMWPTPIP